MLKFDKIWKEGITLQELQNWYDSEINKVAIPKSQYNKKLTTIEDLQGKVAELENTIETSSNNEFEVKYNEAVKVLEDYKTGIEKEKTNASKSELLKSTLNSAGIKNETLLRLAMKDFELDTLEIEEGKFKGFDNILEEYKKNNESLFDKVEIEGHNPANPPRTFDSKTLFTKEQIDKMSQTEINANWEAVSQSLANIK